MKTTLLTLLIGAGALGYVAAGFSQTKDGTPAPGADGAKPDGPKIQFAEIVYDFGKVSSGDVVKHSFVFTNIGTAKLEIKDVRPGCGCTTAGTWDKEVEPGKTGSIPLQFNSANFGGTVMKQATVTCNDASQSNIVLQIKGTVWKAIEIAPSMAVFNVSSEAQTNDTKIVRIVSNLEEPLVLSDLQCTNHSFKAELKTVRPGKEFELHITALPPFTAPSMVAPVTLKTSSTNMPLINVSAYVSVQQPVTVTPGQLMLAAGPLTNAVQQIVAIHSTGTNALVLTDASVSVPDAKVRIVETLVGKSFNLVVDFPVGFQSKPGERVEVSVKSNHPKFAMIKVPVFQPQRPVTTAGTPVALQPSQLKPITAPAAAEKPKQ